MGQFVKPVSERDRFAPVGFLSDEHVIVRRLGGEYRQAGFAPGRWILKADSCSCREIDMLLTA